MDKYSQALYNHPMKKSSMGLGVPDKLTKPVDWRVGIVCVERCDTCVLSLRGCARDCIRFPDLVCQTCPCRASGELSKQLKQLKDLGVYRD